jgi:hypothetical protein
MALIGKLHPLGGTLVWGAEFFRPWFQWRIDEGHMVGSIIH